MLAPDPRPADPMVVGEVESALLVDDANWRRTVDEFYVDLSSEIIRDVSHLRPTRSCPGRRPARGAARPA